MDSGEEGRAGCGVARRNAPPSFQMQERIFTHVAERIEVFVLRSLHGAGFLGRDDDVQAPCSRQGKNRIGVIAVVRTQRTGIPPLNQAASLRPICCGTLCPKDADWHPMRIHGQRSLGVEPPLVRPIS